MMKIKKGDYNYILSKKRADFLISMVFIIMIIIFLTIGILLNGSKANIWTVMAAVTALPAGKKILAFIIILPFHSISNDSKNEILENSKNTQIIFELIFTSYEKLMYVEAASIWNNHIILYGTSSKYTSQTLLSYLTDMCEKNNIRNIKVVKCDSKKDFLDQIDKLNASELTQNQKEHDEYIKELLLAVSI